MAEMSLNRAVRAMLLSTTVRDHDLQQWPRLRRHLAEQLGGLGFGEHELDAAALLFLSVDMAAQLEFARAPTHRRPLAAAYHLLAMDTYQSGAQIAGTSYTLEDFRDLDSERIQRLNPYSGLGVRQKIAAVAGGYGRARGVLAMSSTALQSVADAVLEAMVSVTDTHHREGIHGAFTKMRDRVAFEALRAPHLQAPHNARPQWLDCEIRQTVMEVAPQAGTYVLRTQLQFRRLATDIIIVQISDEAAAVWLCSRFPEVMDSFTTTDSGFIALNVQHREGSEWTNATFIEDTSLTEEIIEAGKKRWPDLQARALRAAGPAGPEQEVNLICDFELEIADGYFYWMAGREVQVKSIEVDISLLMKHVQSTMFIVPKMIPLDPTIRLNAAASWGEVVVNDFVPPGSSLEVHWDNPR